MCRPRHLDRGRPLTARVAPACEVALRARWLRRCPIALRANLVQRAEDWRWSSLWRRQRPDAEPLIPLADWPLALPLDWLEIVNRPQSAGELEALRRSVNRDAPYGDSAWQRATAARYNLEHTLRPRGRPRKGPTRSLPRPE
jgi:REP-associated tyrosine transposase